ncbi:MAG: hypothetical protein A2X94_10270 [Bdellovibrionales bacterium GWB1_55_8]|nr:MAG: hypothetical protein A2X94_10270 [Bdellovibrionales bacterium GWB1_55_8]
MLVAALLKMDYTDYLVRWFSMASWTNVAIVLLPYPIAGIAIYMVRPWSYPVFLTVTAFQTYSDLMTWWNVPHHFSLPLALALTVTNVGLVSYFLIPAVRTTYFNARIRWWESKPRYEIHTPAVLKSAAGEMKCTITNLSEGGAFIRASKKLQPDQEFELHFFLFRRAISVHTKVVHRRWKGMRGYGLEFVHTPSSRKEFARITGGMRLLGAQSPAAHQSFRDFANWFYRALLTGKGWTPEIAPLAQVIPFSRPLKRTPGIDKAA